MAAPKGGQGRRGPRRGPDRDDQGNRGQSDFNEPVVVKINRSAAVVKGGRRFSFSALVVIGNGRGKVGMGYAKAKEVTGAVEKATKDARRNLVDVPRAGNTIPHETHGIFGSSGVKIRPAAVGRGVVACAAVRAVMESAGIQDIVTKSTGNNNPVNLVKATMAAIGALRTIADVEALRGVKLS
jgi:small subunit ribosomal protein S5